MGECLPNAGLDVGEEMHFRDAVELARGDFMGEADCF